MTPLAPLSPLSPSCGQYQSEEDYVLHFNDFFPHLCQQEEHLLHQPAGDDALPIEGQTRRKFVSKLVLVHQQFLSSPLSLYLAVSILDECLKLGKPKLQLQPWVLPSVALAIAGKFEEDLDPMTNIKSINQAMEDSATEEQLVDAERKVLIAIDFHLHRPTAEHHRQWFVECVCLVDPEMDKERLMGASEYLCEMTLLCAAAGRWAPTVHAACACVVAGVLLGRSCEQHMKGLLPTDRHWTQLCLAMRQLYALLAEPDACKSTVYRKYATLEYSYISIKVHQFLEKELARMR